MPSTLKTFLATESGALTVDWVLLTAMLVGMGLSVMAVVGQGTSTLSGSVETTLEEDHTTPQF